MNHRGVLLTVLPLVVACVEESDQVSVKQLAAEQYFNGVYACDQAALDSLAADDIVISYPIFDSLFGTPAIRGRSNVLGFAARYCSHWSDPEITIHEVVEDGNRVVLVWAFTAVGGVQDSAAVTTTPKRQSWGGISFLRFDSTGRVIEELGEESTPGPIARLRGDLDRARP